METIDTSKRNFLISSTAGFTGLVIAQTALTKPVVNLLNPGSPLVIPDNFEPCVGSQCRVAVKRTYIYFVRK